MIKIEHKIVLLYGSFLCVILMQCNVKVLLFRVLLKRLLQFEKPESKSVKSGQKRNNHNSGNIAIVYYI